MATYDPSDDDWNDELYQCDCCGKMYPLSRLHFISHGALGNSAGCDTTQCSECEDKARKEGGWK